MSVVSGELDGKVAFVAGCTGPLGHAIARSLSSAGAAVAVHYRSDAASANKLVAELNGPAFAVHADVTNSSAVDEAFSSVEEHLGSVDILVNAAHSPQSPTAFVDLSDAQLDAQFDSAKGHAFLCRRALPAMRASGWGRVVYVSGALMTRPSAGFAAYGASKSAASTLTRYVALEEGRNGITANIVAPGRVIDPSDTEPLTAEWQSLSDRLLERTALGAFPDTEEVAAIVGLLVGHGSDQLTGQTLWATGGEPIA